MSPSFKGMVVFRLRGDNELTEKVNCERVSQCNHSSLTSFQLLKRLNHRGRLHAVPASLKGKYVIRFTVTSTHTTNDDIIKDWTEIRNVATDILEECNAKIDKRVPLKGKIFFNFSHLMRKLSLTHSIHLIT
jgi:histidine decarboxylase